MIDVIILQRPRLITARGSEHEATTEETARLLSVLVMSHPQGISTDGLIEKLGISTAGGVQSAIGRLRRWLEGLALGAPKGANRIPPHDPVPFRGNRYVLNPIGGFTSDWERLQDLLAEGLPSSYAVDTQALEQAWDKLSEINSLVPPASAIRWELLPALEETTYANSLRAQVLPALVARAEVGLALGDRANVVANALRPIFNDSPADENIADVLARAHQANGDRTAALRVLEDHKVATAALDAEVSEAINALRQRVLKQDSRATPDRPSDLTSTPTARTASQAVTPLIREGIDVALVESARTVQLSILLPPLLSATAEHRTSCRAESLAQGFEGEWYQASYPASDPRLAGDPWSIELVKAEAHESNVVSGSWSRKWRQQLHKTWSFRGFDAEGTLGGRYDAVSDSSAGSGFFSLSRISCCVAYGWFTETRTFTRGPAASFTFEPALLLWVRGSISTDFLRPWLEEVQS